MAITYRPSVRIGNWFEDLCLEEDEIRNFLIKKQNRTSLIERTRILTNNLFKETELDAPSDTIRFGAVVQILSFFMQACSPDTKLKPALSAVMTEPVIKLNRTLSDQCEVVLARSKDSRVRNTFKIISGDNKNRTNELLKFGQDFCLQCVDSDNGPLLLYSIQKSPNLRSIIPTTFTSNNRGEINIPVGLCYKCNMGPGTGIPSACARWRCFHPEPQKRFETNGYPLPSNSPLVITHSATNRSLAAENIVIQTLLGTEHMVSVQNYYDQYNRESLQNLWIIAIGNQHKF